MTRDLLPLKQAELVWKMLMDNHRGDIPAVAQKLRTIDDATALRSCKLSMLSLADSSATVLQAMETPQTRARTLDELAFGSDETPKRVEAF